MTILYLLRTINGDPDPSNPTPIMQVDSRLDGEPHGSLPPEWMQEMRRTPIDVPLERAKAYRAPPMPAAYARLVQVFHRKPGVPLPDFWVASDTPIVSERAMRTIQELDDFPHQFVPTELRDPEGNRIDEGRYYLFNVRRRVDIDRTEPGFEHADFKFSLMPSEGQCMTTVHQTPGLSDALAAFPLWCIPRGPAIYLNEATLKRFRDAGLTGLTPYSSFLGGPAEALRTNELAVR